MTRLVIGTALGYMVALAVLYGLRQLSIYALRQLSSWLGRAQLPARAGQLTLPRGFAFVGAFNKYAVLVGAGAAVITLAAWAVGDYLAAKSARSVAMVSVPGTSGAARASDPAGWGDELAGLVAPRVDSASAMSDEKGDPYTDPDFKVHRHPRHADAPPSLKETLVQRSEARARDDLLREMQQHAARSQYDCEAAIRADKYLKAGLDVWGFAAWQLKYFPMDSYKGAALTQCRDLKEILDPTRVNLRSAVAQRNQR